MQSLLAVLLTGACLVFAGCTAVPSDSSTTSPGTSAPPSSPPGPGFAPQQHSDSTQHPNDAKFTLRGDLRECPAGFCLQVNATNASAKTYYVSSICTPEWRERMERDGQEVQHRESMAYCAAWGVGPFAPGTSRTYELEWNKTLWNDADGSYKPAGNGDYAWTFELMTYSDADGNGYQTLVVQFPILIGAAT